MKRIEIKQELIRLGWERDRFGHFKKSNGNDNLRIKMQRISIRFEVQVKIADKNEWFRIYSNYNSNITPEILEKIDNRTKARKL